MKKFYLLLSFVFLMVSIKAQQKLAIIPKPVSLIQDKGSFNLPNLVRVSFINPSPSNNLFNSDNLFNYMNHSISIPTGKKMVLLNKNLKSDLRMELNKNWDSILGKEGYQLKVYEGGISIKGNTQAGLFYGFQTLMQLMPKEIESGEAIKNMNWQIPYVTILDYPRFAWRGLMFDVSRHFFTKEEVKSYIHQMARYKYNLLHLHLTDDEGWRIEIKSYPLLTKIGAYRANKIGYFGTFPPPTADEPYNDGGFFTQEDIKELVSFAKDNFVEILPEIDVPGHSLAAIASYPELSCTPGANTYHVRSGEKIMEFNPTGLKALVDNTLCPANEKVYDFLDKVLGEIASLFPFDYIHMGGDECAKNFWDQSDAIKALMTKEGLKNQLEVQSYFEKRIEKIVESKGKKFMGWDEILEGGLAPDAVVMSWRGMAGGIQAAKLKHNVVMSPTDFVYFDYMQGDRVIEPHVYATLRLNKTYSFEPLPDSINPNYILGGQANLWTEQVYTFRHAEYMTWPRAFAVSECLWTPKALKNWDDFFSRVENHFQRFDIAQVKYAPSVYDPIFNASYTSDKKLKIELSTEVTGLDTYYSFDNSFPDEFYPKYSQTLIAPKDAVMLKVITYRGKKPIGRMISMPIEELKNRASKIPANDE